MATKRIEKDSKVKLKSKTIPLMFIFAQKVKYVKIDINIDLPGGSKFAVTPVCRYLYSHSMSFIRFQESKQDFIGSSLLNKRETGSGKHR